MNESVCFVTEVLVEDYFGNTRFLLKDGFGNGFCLLLNRSNWILQYYKNYNIREIITVGL